MSAVITTSNGPTIPATANLLKGDGSGGVSNSGLVSGEVLLGTVAGGSVLKLGSGQLVIAAVADTDYLPPAGNGSALSGVAKPADITLAAIEAAASITLATDNTYAIPTSITIVKGIITAIS